VLGRIFVGDRDAACGDETNPCAQQIFHAAKIGGPSPMAS
jgi:hypothetical protein